MQQAQQQLASAIDGLISQTFQHLTQQVQAAQAAAEEARAAASAAQQAPAAAQLAAILSALDDLRAGQDALRAGQDALRAGQDTLRAELRAELRAGQDALRAGQDALRAELRAELRAGQDALRTELRAGLQGLRGELTCCARNAVVCRDEDAPIVWPPHHGVAIAAEFDGGAQRPGTRGELNAAAIAAVDALLEAYGLPNGPASGAAGERRRTLMAHIGVVP
jgi:hypothetical protein